MRIYNVGLNRGGTTSIHQMFSNFRSAHEPMIMKLVEAAVGDCDMRAVIEEKRQHGYEVESSCWNFHALPILLEDPEAKFLLSIRTPYLWVRSMIVHIHKGQLGRMPLWTKMLRQRFGSYELRYGETYRPREEASLQKFTQFRLDGFFKFWQFHNRTVIDMVPPERLHIVPTAHMNDRLPQIAAFCDVPVEKLKRAHANKTEYKADDEPYAQLPEGYVRRLIDAHCPLEKQLNWDTGELIQ